MGHQQVYLLEGSYLNIKKVLLTGGRAPSTMELARFFSKRNIEVHVAESFPASISKKSNYIRKFHLTSKPKQETKRFINDLVEIITSESIDLYIPTCEEIFYVAEHKEQFPQTCLVFVEDFEKMRLLHDKYDFIKKASQYGLNTPRTIKVKTEAEWNQQLLLLEEGKNYMAKPVYTRFSNEILLLPVEKNKRITIHQQKQWVIQEFIDGEQFCSYSIVEKGEIIAHTTYKTEFRAGKGSSIAFRHKEEKDIFNWIARFVKNLNFTGQIAFDFIKTNKGEIYPIECNPRLTSGIHLFRGTNIVEVFTKENKQIIVPKKNQGILIVLAMILYSYQNIKQNGLKDFLKTFFTYKDVLFDKRDIKPLFYQFYSYYKFWEISKKENIDLLEATTYDLSWNGDER